MSFFLEVTQYYLTKNDCYKAGRTIVPKGIMVHSTGANNRTLRRYVGPDDGLLGPNRYNNHWNQSGISKCVHAFIGILLDGTVACYQTLPWNHRGWHAARGVNGSANDTHISFEICEDDRTGVEYFAEVYEKALALCAMLCKEFDLDPMAPGVLIDHAEGHRLGIASNHSDVGHWFPLHGKSMDIFRADVAELLKEGGEHLTTPHHYVNKGDGMWALAKLFGIPYNTFLIYNPHIDDNAKTIYWEHDGDILFKALATDFELDYARQRHAHIICQINAKKTEEQMEHLKQDKLAMSIEIGDLRKAKAFYENSLSKITPIALSIVRISEERNE